MPASLLLSAPPEIREMILKAALDPSGRTVDIVLSRASNGKVKCVIKRSFGGILSACKQLRDEISSLRLLRAGIILDIKNDANHRVSIEQIVPSEASRNLITVVFYDLPERNTAKDIYTFPLLESVLTLPNLHTLGFKNNHIFGLHHDEFVEARTVEEIRSYELDVQASGLGTQLVLQWPFGEDSDSEDNEILIVDDHFTARPDVCIMLNYVVTGYPGCIGGCSYYEDWHQRKQEHELLNEADGNDGSDGHGSLFDWEPDHGCLDMAHWETVAIREPNQKTWRFIEGANTRGRACYIEIEKQVFARVEELE